MKDTKLKTTKLKNYLKSWGSQVVKDAKENLNAAGKGGGNLERSIKVNVTENNGEFDIQFSMADYGAFVDKGVRGIGGTIKSQNKRTNGVRFYQTWDGKKKQSPFKFGSGRGSGSIYTGIGSFIRKKGLQPRSKGGQFMTTAGLKIAIVRTLWIKGIKGISFFQKPFGSFYKDLPEGLLKNLKADIIDSLMRIGLTKTPKV